MVLSIIWWLTGFLEHIWLRASLVAEQWRIHLQRRRCGFNSWVRKIPGVGHGTPLQYSWVENLMDRGPWWATVHGDAESDASEWLNTHTHTHTHTNTHTIIWNYWGTSLVVQWVKISASNAGRVGLIPAQEAGIPHALWPKKETNNPEAVL